MYDELMRDGPRNDGSVYDEFRYSERVLKTRRCSDYEGLFANRKAECANTVFERMDDMGLLVGMPPQDNNDSTLKDDIALHVVDEFFQVRLRVVDWLKEKVEKEGVLFLKTRPSGRRRIFEIADRAR